MQDKHVVIFHGREDRDIFINKCELPKTIYHIDGIGGKAEPGDIIVDNHQVTDWIMAKHIVDNYDNLPEYTIFTQADPNDHCVELSNSIKCKFTDKYGSFCFARSLCEQFTFGWQRLHSAALSAERLGIGFHNSMNDRKIMYYFAPGNIFYVHRDRIRERPKSFYQSIIDLDNDEDFFNYVENYNLPYWVYREIDKCYPNLKKLSKKEKIVQLTKLVPQYITQNSSKKRDDYFGISTEPLFTFLIFMDKKIIKIIDEAQSVMGNKLYFNTNNSHYNYDFYFNKFPYHDNKHQTTFNFKQFEENWFDRDCPYFKKWQEFNKEKLRFEARKSGRNEDELVRFFENLGFANITC